MKAAEVLKLARISRRHLSRLVNRGQIRVTIQPNGRYNYNREDVYLYIGSERQNLQVIYARVSTPKQKTDLKHQIELLENFCVSRGIVVDKVFSDVASDLYFSKRKQFFAMLDLVLDGQVKTIFISYKDRLSLIGFSLFKHLFQKFGTSIIVTNESGDDHLESEEIINEIITLIHCFSMKHYSKRRLKSAVAEALNEGFKNPD